MTTTSLTWDTTAAAEAVPSPQIRPRDLGFDAVRLVASISIVWAHTPRSAALQWLGPIGSFGTCFFTGASIYYMTRALRSDPDRSFAAYAQTRFRRLYLPFLAWSALYLLFRDTCRAVVSNKPLVDIGPMNLLAGGENHLWFLPFIFLVGLAAFPIVRVAMQSRAARLMAITCAVTGVALILNANPVFEPEMDTVNFYRCVWFALPSTFFGIAIALSDELVERLRARAPWTTLAAMSVTALSIVAGVRYGVMLWEKNIAGIGWLLAALSVPQRRWPDWIARCTPLAFGLYLIHPLVLGLVRAAGQLARFGNGAAFDLGNFLLAVICSLAIAWGVRQTRTLRWLMP